MAWSWNKGRKNGMHIFLQGNLCIIIILCSAQTRKLRNLGITLRKVGIHTLARNPRIAQFFARSGNTLRKPCTAHICSYKVRFLI